MRPEKALALCVIVAFIVPSINSLSTLGNPVTRDEAIEISKGAEGVKYSLANAVHLGIETYYKNSSKYAPEGRSVWEVVWHFDFKDKPGGYTYIVVVDAEIAKIVHEEMGILFF